MPHAVTEQLASTPESGTRLSRKANGPTGFRRSGHFSRR
ncbi:hypothetical protein C7S13_0570 [Burkholderia cepacia]|nr:hypothetical protein [Burkholderia cepacia]